METRPESLSKSPDVDFGCVSGIEVVVAVLTVCVILLGALGICIYESWNGGNLAYEAGMMAEQDGAAIYQMPPCFSRNSLQWAEGWMDSRRARRSESR